MAFLRRGDVALAEESVVPGFLSVLTGGREFESYKAACRDASLDSTFRRSAVAMWMTDVNDGAGALLARVIVNRIWQHYFGSGLMQTPNDFGLQGERPTHPELLDWLASQLIRNEWQLKSIRGASRAFADNVRAKSPKQESQVATAFEIALSRSPRPDESVSAIQFLNDNDGPDPLADLCQVLLISNELMYVE